MSPELIRILTSAYQAQYMGKGTKEAATAVFLEHKDNEEFIKEARAELARAQTLAGSRCASSKAASKFLTEALSKIEST